MKVRQKNSGFSLIEVMIFAVLIPASMMVVAVQLDNTRIANKHAQKMGIKQGLRNFFNENISCQNTVEAYLNDCTTAGKYINLRDSSDRDLFQEQPQGGSNEFSQGIKYPYRNFGFLKHSGDWPTGPTGSSESKVYNVVKAKCQKHTRTDSESGSSESWYEITPEVAFASRVISDRAGEAPPTFQATDMYEYAERNFVKAVNVPITCLTKAEQEREDAEEADRAPRRVCLDTETKTIDFLSQAHSTFQAYLGGIPGDQNNPPELTNINFAQYDIDMDQLSINDQTPNTGHPDWLSIHGLSTGSSNYGESFFSVFTNSSSQLEYKVNYWESNGNVFTFYPYENDPNKISAGFVLYKSGSFSKRVSSLAGAEQEVEMGAIEIGSSITVRQRYWGSVRQPLYITYCTQWEQ